MKSFVLWDITPLYSVENQEVFPKEISPPSSESKNNPRKKSAGS
jgi:hypothetical protein